MPEEPDSGSGAQSARRSRRAELGSIVAVVVSVIALGLNVYQTRIIQEQARAGVWPYLSFGVETKESDTGARYAFTLDNDGVGPAIIKSVRVTFDGRPVHTWLEVVKLIVGTATTENVGIATVHGLVLPAGTNRDTKVEAISVSDPAKAKIFIKANPRIRMEICYCSVYDDCWIISTTDGEDLRPVSRCKSAGDDEFRN